MTRKHAREQAFLLIFEKSFHEEPIPEIIQNAVESREFVGDDFVESVTNGIFENLEQIDAKIEKNIRGWTMDRVSRVALSVMRLAVYEMLFVDNIPTSVSINEAVELTKKYGGEDDSSYINGVLGSIAKQIEAES